MVLGFTIHTDMLAVSRNKELGNRWLLRHLGAEVAESLAFYDSLSSSGCDTVRDQAQQEPNQLQD